MKLKRTARDFQVEEVTDFPLAPGRFAVYRLAKEGMGTLEAVAAVARRWRLPSRAIAFGGLKDRHALTSQHLTIERGPARGLQQEKLWLEYLGQAPRPFAAGDIRGNRFVITVRALVAGEVQAAREAAAGLQSDGVPNYFDEQRFGSRGVSGRFVAEPWCRGDYEQALWLAIAEANPHDRPSDSQRKTVFREGWGDWPRCLAAAGKGDARTAVEHLAARGGDFRGALAGLPVAKRGLYLAAFQSHLWNCVLADWLADNLNSAHLVRLQVAGEEVPFPCGLATEERTRFAALALPLPSARARAIDPSLVAHYQRVLGSLGLELRELRVKYPRDSFFSKGDRAACFKPRGLALEAGDDELYPGARKLVLRFELPRGCYGTMVVKRLLLGGGAEGEKIARDDAGC